MANYLQAGYPKSGNTWLLALIMYLYKEYDIFRPFFPSVGGAPFNGWVRTHNPSINIPINEVVYTIRHPLDVCCSAFRTQTENHGRALPPLSEYAEHFINGGGFDDHYGYAGSWMNNVSYWLNFKVAPVRILKYEETSQTPNGLFNIKALTDNFTKAEITKCWEDTHANTLRSKQPFRQDLNKQSCFIGPANSRWKDLIPENLWPLARQKFEPLLTELNYKI